MKKLMSLTLVAMLSIATVAEAKRGGGMRVAKSKPSASQTHKQPQPDANFANTPNTGANGAAIQAQQAQRGAGMNNFVTGAAAGYLLSNVLAPSEAQAQTSSPSANSAEATQAVSSAQQFANSATLPAFKSVDPTDPNLIERNANYARYCLGGMQYLVSGSKAIVLVDGQNQPQRCVITP